MNKLLLLCILGVSILSGCKKVDGTISIAQANDYLPLKTGKYINYNLDSTIYINFGSKDTVVKYQVQDRVDSQITDNLGRKAFRIIRFIRRDSTQAWSANNSFMAIATSSTVEYVENNHRFLKLVSPVKEANTWKGNTFIDTYSINSDVKYLDDWDYVYSDMNTPITLGNVRIDSTVTVKQRDEFLGQDPHIPSTQYAEKNYSIEKYGKNIGLIYKEFLHFEYQGGQPQRPAYYVGYGVKMTMTGHN